jgi:hypothetical protein
LHFSSNRTIIIKGFVLNFKFNNMAERTKGILHSGSKANTLEEALWETFFKEKIRQCGNDLSKRFERRLEVHERSN